MYCESVKLKEALPSPSSLKFMRVMVQKIIETAPSTSNGVGSDENTFGKVYKGEVPTKHILCWEKLTSKTAAQSATQPNDLAQQLWRKLLMLELE